MSRPSVTQRQRNKDNPIDLGTFSQTSLRYITGGLGPKWKLIGYKDTSLNSNGGIGGGTYNAWYKVKITNPAWLIVAKGPPRPDYVQVSVYDLNTTPIQGRMIWDADSITTSNPNTPDDLYYPYFDQVMGAQSNLYNTYDKNRLDKGNELYYPLEAGSYLLCVSSTRNEDIDYAVGIVIEFPSEAPYYMRCEDINEVLVAVEDDIDLANTLEILSPITGDLTIGPDTNGFTEDVAEIIPSGTTVTVEATGIADNRATWLIAPVPSGEDVIILDTTPDWQFTFHSHSLADWQEAWYRDHQSTSAFPEVFVPLTDRF